MNGRRRTTHVLGLIAAAWGMQACSGEDALEERGAPPALVGGALVAAQAARAWVPLSDGFDAVLVVGSLPLGASDDALRVRLEGLGFTVTSIDDAAVTGVAVADADVVVVSSSVSASAIGTTLTDVDVAVVSAESATFGPLGMVTSAGDLSNQLRVYVPAPSPFAPGLAGATRVYFAKMSLGFGVPSPAADVVATVFGDPGKATVFVYDTCDEMPGLPAPNRRVGLYIEGADNLTDSGWVLFDTTVAWAAAGDSGSGVCGCTPTGADTNCDGVDDDCDGVPDDEYVPVPTVCGVGACVATGTLSCVGGEEVDSCEPGTAAANDATCDGVDDDCDGVEDEDYVATGTTCGVGACGATGTLSCVGGEEVDSCEPGTAAANDATCDGADDDCDGDVDEDYTLTETTCGVGACSSTGTLFCVSGTEIDSCEAGTPAADDPTCDGVDDDCDGLVDEDYVPITTTCGVGACGSGGWLECIDGDEVDTCEVKPPASEDATCDGVDDDCDGEADEGYVATGTTCGVGACGATGTLTCVGGEEVDSCEPGTPAANDLTCDGVDDDCDGLEDEDYVATGTTCGVGACGATGTLSCVGGEEVDSCEPGTGAANDLTCDGVDDDCDGTADEDYVESFTTCGIGICAATGRLTCVGGVEHDDCEEGVAQPDDSVCNGLDDDCDGDVDEDYVSTATTCGVGACGATGIIICEEGEEVDSCEPGTPATDDATCDGVDDDCDGTDDEDYPVTDTSCGVGACVATGILTCVSGTATDSCEPGTPAADDATCNGVDDDCDGVEDEDYAAPETTCGVGVCAATGTLECVGGVLDDTCTASEPPVSLDLTCDGLDDDCDGDPDDDFEPVDTTCGKGACAATGLLTCDDGVVSNSCVPGTAAADDATCDGVDDDCDGLTDEDYAPTDTTCGVGACGATGTLTCGGGEEVDSCDPGTPAADDATCDGVDDDCDGLDDEDYAPTDTSCGIGACGATGTLECVGGVETDSCKAGTPAADDVTCDAIDDDCDGEEDEDYVPPVTECGVGVCAATGTLECVGGVLDDTCTASEPAVTVDLTCDGLDDDCDGEVDDDFEPVETTCGVGACVATGLLTCDDGVVSNSCDPGTPAADDATCDGVDDDCDGAEDEDYAPTDTACGVGACGATGTLTCVGGEEVDSCEPGTPASGDATCDGIDDDCDGTDDEDYAPTATTCGVGACSAAGTLTCVGGEEVDSCDPGTPADSDTTCDGVDDDCDGTDDEDFPESFTSCGVGICAATGRLTCVNGTEHDDCEEGTAAPDDSVCNGLDDDCDGVEDEDYVPTDTSCGVGACASTGTLECVDGALDDTCTAGTPALDDATCDGVDDDCDGTEDEDYLPSDTICGVGACGATGTLTCVAGIETDSCDPGTPADSDATCDGVDDDCDGVDDEDYAESFTTCGVGICAATGRLTCVDGAEHDDCEEGAAAPDDSLCNGLDDDCDGDEDEDYVASPTFCGVGACASTGTLECVDGELDDTCLAGTPAPSDATCDGVDDDCNGAEDDGFPETSTTCGIGACAASGEELCIDAEIVDTCTEGTPAPDDATCDGTDDDCDGTDDEDYDPLETNCGVGACASTGTLECVDGELDDTCTAGTPAANDATCDGVDDDCDTFEDEDYVATPTECGVGVCAATGVLACVDGAIGDTCAPGTPAPDDSVCNGLDDDCSGEADEDYAPEEVTCGVGGCEVSVLSACVDGNVVADCVPLPPETFEICDGIDNDCDGASDEPDGSLRWSLVPGAGPPARWGAAMALDEDRGIVVLFGGSRADNGSVAETWEWDGVGWSLVATSGPPERIDHAMAYDADRGVTVLFGGVVDNFPSGDTWEWDGATWSLVATGGPSPRYAHAMAYDPVRGVTVLFGGRTATTEVGDTWEWNGATWTERTVAGPLPSPRKGHAMAFDPDEGAVVLFGGFDALVRADTWQWDGTAWSEVITAAAPQAREEHTTVYDPARGAIVLFGGIGAFAEFFGDAWLGAASAWVDVDTLGPAPTPRFLHAMGYDAVNDASLVYGGVEIGGAISGETWLLGETCYVADE